MTVKTRVLFFFTETSEATMDIKGLNISLGCQFVQNEKGVSIMKLHSEKLDFQDADI